MSRGVIQPSQQKLAEKLTILNDRGIGMLTRVYNIKKVRTLTNKAAEITQNCVQIRYMNYICTCISDECLNNDRLCESWVYTDC